MDANYKISEELITIGRKLVDSGLVIATWGNISVFIPEKEQVIITPSGMEYEYLTPEDLVVLNLQGDIVHGTRKPSSEKDLHLEVYKARKDVRAIIHTHSNYATSVAVARMDIPPLTEDMVQLLGGSIRATDYAQAGTTELAIETVKALGKNNGVLLANHGVVGVGRNLKEAMNVCQMIEKGAQLFINSRILGKTYSISEDEVEEMRASFLNHYGQK